MAVYEIAVIDAARQQLDTVLAGKAVSLTLWWNEWRGRWSLSVAIDGTPVLSGRRLVPGTDLLGGYGLGLGRLFLVDWEGKGAEPDRAALPAGRYRLWHDDGPP